MNSFFGRALIGVIAFILLDGLWLGLLMKGFYRDQLAPIARMANGGFAPNWAAALVVYVLLGAGIAWFVVPRASGLVSAAGIGALFGAGGLRRIRFHQLLDAAAVAIRAHPGRRRLGRGRLGGMRGGDLDVRPMTHTAEPARYPIRAVSKLTGIAIDTLRAWERRYGAVTPRRDDRGRMYTDADVTRLRLLHQAVSSGHAIGRVATLSDEELRGLAPALSAPAGTPQPASATAALNLSVLDEALRKLDGAMIDREFARLAAVLPPLELVRDVLLPTLRDVGDKWDRHRGGIAHEHMISSAMRNLLGTFLRVYGGRRIPVRLLFATPSGDRHEIGILAAAMLAASQGLEVSYLGPDLPGADTIQAVASSGAQVLVLGLTLTSLEASVTRELKVIVDGLPAHVELWIGGPGGLAHADLLRARALTLGDFDHYLLQLWRLGGRV